MLLPVLLALSIQRPSTITFVRHGETVANKTGKYSEKTLNTFSAEGQLGVDRLTQRLVRGVKFDRILVSPSPRAMMTIAPYLRLTRQHAIIWPLLYECCTGRRPANAHPVPFKWGSRVSIPKEFRDLFELNPGQDRYPVAPKYNEGLSQVDAAIAEFKRLYSGGSILIVGHSGQGGHFIHELTGKWIKLDNAKEVVVRTP
jgi:broad specificity phosphatase PhoE